MPGHEGGWVSLEFSRYGRQIDRIHWVKAVGSLVLSPTTYVSGGSRRWIENTLSPRFLHVRKGAEQIARVEKQIDSSPQHWKSV